MTRANGLIRHYQNITSRPSRHHVSTSASTRTSSSPQRWTTAPNLEASPAKPKPFSDIPGPLALPMLRHSAHVLPRIGIFHHTVGVGLLEGLRSKYGDLVRLAKGSRKRPVLYVFDPEIMREVYESHATAPPRWEKSPLSKQRKEDSNRCPIQGDESKAIWAAVRSLLMDASLLNHFESAFEDIATDVTRRLGDLRRAENALNEELETEVYRWALESLGVLLFGMRLGCLNGATHVPSPENRSPEKTSMEDDDDHQCSLAKRPFGDLTSAECLVRCSKEIADLNYLTRSEKTLRNESQDFKNALLLLDKHFSITEEYLRQALEALNSGTSKPELAFLDKVRPLKHKLLPVAANMLLAGVEPLAQSALATLYHLSLHPAQQQRAHDEVVWATASANAGAGTPQMPYIASCAREALRLLPITGGVVRRSREEMVVAGYHVPEGVDIVLAHGVSSRSEQWGRPNAFIPDRWCPEGWEPLKASRAHPIASLPFGESCPAEGIVGKMLASLTTKLLAKYKLEWHGPAPKIITTGVNKIGKPFYFVFQDV